MISVFFMWQLHWIQANIYTDKKKYKLGYKDI